MKRTLRFFLILLAFYPGGVYAQSGLKQYFDGADTTPGKALFIIRDTAAGNIWQIGRPGKTIFNSASTQPNAIVTDTLNLYPANDTSRFAITFKHSDLNWGRITAVRWKQKLDLEKGHSGGVVEFSVNGGAWQNIFNNPNVYNLYGFLQSNKDTLPGNIYAFSGKDVNWRDIWFCLQSSGNDSATVAVRFSLLTDTTSAGRDGWMIDNLLAQRTAFHTVAQVPSIKASKVYPTLTSGAVFVEATQQHAIKSVHIMDANGKVVQQYVDDQSRYLIDIGNQAAGKYFVRVVTDLGSELFQVVLQK